MDHNDEHGGTDLRGCRLPGCAGVCCGRTINDTREDLAKKLRQIKYASTATINFGYRRAAVKHPLNGFGFVVPFIEKRTLMACTFSSVKFPGRAPDEHVLLRAFAGGALQPEIFALDEAEMKTRVEADLRELLGITEAPLFTEVAKWERSMPQYEVGHLDRVKEIEEIVKELPGLTLAGNSYRGAGLPDCIRSGETAAAAMSAQEVFSRKGAKTQRSDLRHGRS